MASAQNITGKVTDAQGKPLPGASVYWADTSVGVATDLEGKFSLYRVKDNNALVASFLGYTNDTLRVEQKVREVEFRLNEGVTETVSDKAVSLVVSNETGPDV